MSTCTSPCLSGALSTLQSSSIASKIHLYKPHTPVVQLTWQLTGEGHHVEVRDETVNRWGTFKGWRRWRTYTQLWRHDKSADDVHMYAVRGQPESWGTLLRAMSVNRWGYIRDEGEEGHNDVKTWQSADKGHTQVRDSSQRLKYKT